VPGHAVTATATGSQDSCSLTILPPEISPPAAAANASIARRPFMSSGPEPTKLEPPGAENAKTSEQGRTRRFVVSSSCAFAFKVVARDTSHLAGKTCMEVSEGFSDKTPNESATQAIGLTRGSERCFGPDAASLVQLDVRLFEKRGHSQGKENSKFLFFAMQGKLKWYKDETTARRSRLNRNGDEVGADDGGGETLPGRR